MSKTKRASSRINQQVKVLKYIVKCGDINRFDADSIGVCHLAGRIKELKLKGIMFKSPRKNNIKDKNGVKHNGISHYSIDWHKMSEKSQKLFSRLISNHSQDD